MHACTLPTAAPHPACAPPDLGFITNICRHIISSTAFIQTVCTYKDAATKPYTICAGGNGLHLTVVYRFSKKL
jgi:hypothetical protein